MDKKKIITKKTILMVSICLVLAIGITAEEKGFNKLTDIKYYDVSDSVVMVRHPFGANITCISLEDGLIFVDCGMKTEFARDFRKKMEKKFKKYTKALLITHGHIDHFFGMAAFSDVNVIAAVTGRDLFKRQLAIDWNPKNIETYTKIFPKFKESVSTAKPFMPTIWVNKESSVGSGDSKVLFTNTGGHSSCSSSAYFAKEKILVGGDLVQVDQYVYFGDPSTSLKNWIATLQRWHDMEIVKVCPGHGRTVGKDYLKPIWQFFETLISVVKKLKEEKVPISQVVNNASLPKGYWGDHVAKPRWWNYCIATLFQKL